MYNCVNKEKIEPTYRYIHPRVAKSEALVELVDIMPTIAELVVCCDGYLCSELVDVCVCVCVCGYVYVYLYVYVHMDVHVYAQVMYMCDSVCVCLHT